MDLSTSSSKLNHVRSQLVRILDQHAQQDVDMFKQYKEMSSWLQESGFHTHPKIKITSLDRYIHDLGRIERIYAEGMISYKELIIRLFCRSNRLQQPIMKLMDYVYARIVCSDNIIELFYYFIQFEGLVLHVMRRKNSRELASVDFKRALHQIKQVFALSKVEYCSYKNMIDGDIIKLIHV